MKSMQRSYDAVIVGSGPNGLAAAIKIAQAGRSVIVYEAKGTVGGGMRSAQLTLPGYIHDICSAVHPLTVASPFLRTLPIERYGVEWVESPVTVAHPLDNGTAVAQYRSIDRTASELGKDSSRYHALIAPLVDAWDVLLPTLLGPLQPSSHILPLARFGIPALTSAQFLGNHFFQTEAARAFFAGLSAHSIQPLNRIPTSAFGLILAMSGHAVGWPFPRGGAQHIADAMAAHLISLGGEIVLDTPITSMKDLPPARTVLFDLTPRQIIAIAGNDLPPRYVAALQRYRYGPGAFKIDFALDGPIPWTAPACAEAATVHLGGTLAEIATSEQMIWHGQHPDRPYVLLAQHSLFDDTRAPTGKHTVWAYCHVPNGSTIDMTDAIERQIERFAPGFRDRILARHTMNTTAIEAYNANYIGGDINGGAQDILQLFTRPLARWNPYTTPNRRIFICSSSTPPGGGVHGMCGYHAAKAALKRM